MLSLASFPLSFMWYSILCTSYPMVISMNYVIDTLWTQRGLSQNSFRKGNCYENKFTNQSKHTRIKIYQAQLVFPSKGMEWNGIW